MALTPHSIFTNPMPQFANFRFFSSLQRLKTFPFSIHQMGMASVADTLYTHLHKNDDSVENSLSKVKPKLDSKCVIQVLSKCHPKQPQLGVRFFVWAGFQHGYRHSAYMYRKACNLLGISENPQIICDVVESYEAEGCLVTVNMIREVLKLCKEAQLADVGLWVLRKVVSFDLNADTVMYNVVIRLYCKKGDIEVAEKLVREMSSNGLSPDLITFMAVVEGLCVAGRAEDAYSVLKVMRGHGCLPNLVVLSAVLDGLCRCGSMERALELLEEMEKSGDCSPNVVTYTCVIQNFCKRGQWSEALDILDRMRAFGCHANHVTVFTLIESLCADGHVDEAYGLIDKFVVEHGVSYSDCHSSLVISLIKIKRLEEAEKLFRKMLAGDVKPDTLASSLLLKELCTKERVLDGFYLLEAIDNMGCLSSIDSDIYSILLLGLCQRSHLTEATKLAKIMIKKSVLLRPLYKDSVIVFLAKSGEKDLVHQLTGMCKGL
ncbi:pentatricopeptide repeat-containing protein At5g47360 isoform X1 [Abrus precatorius]|uniref:Pentatricopeptide repeat-containing protein At5g47360 isoform X1 n=1 Tax=Abrus precatorius TaxID=3816 RepID=A0A8B8JMZ9_ABRPR|nr:pentatricopeptide repeat-containing protein At5g47360 isoform X1 [Abrus precatorius]XP_027332665.1 pentatricopeptide repeat-containing protein At5g47360 isoform X1 [Abrus precatorius]